MIFNDKLNSALSKHFAKTRKPRYWVERELNMPPTTLSKIIHGSRKAKPEEKKALAKYLKCKIHDLFESEENQNKTRA